MSESSHVSGSKGSKRRQRKTKLNSLDLVTQTNGLSDVVKRKEENSDEDQSWQVATKNNKQNPNLQKKNKVETLPVKVFEGIAKGPKDKVKPNSSSLVRNEAFAYAKEEFLNAMQEIKVPDNSDRLTVMSATDKMNQKPKLEPKNRKKSTTVSDDILNQLANCTVLDSSNIPTISESTSKKSRDIDQPLTFCEMLHTDTGDETKVSVLGAGTEFVPIPEHNDVKPSINTGNVLCTNNEITDEIWKIVIGNSPKSKKKRKAMLRNECSTTSSVENGNTGTSPLSFPESVVKPLAMTAMENATMSSHSAASIWDLDKSMVKSTSTDEESSPQSGDSPRGKKGKTKWLKVNPELIGIESPRFTQTQDSLIQEQIYEAVVLETQRQCFVALVDELDIRVLVFSQRFWLRGAKTAENVPITCVLKIGDRVKLTAVPRNTHKDGPEWVAKECWQEGPVSARGPGQKVRQSVVTKLGIRAVKLADRVYVFSKVLFLFGFHLAHPNVNLMDIFQLGDELKYTLPCDDLTQSGPFEAEKAWFGSLPADGDDKPSNEQQFELIKFCKARSIPMSVIIDVCGMNKNAASNKDDFEDVYSDIFSTEDQLLPTTSADFPNKKGRVVMGIKRQHSIKITSTEVVLTKKQMELAKLEDKIQQETEMYLSNVPMASASMTNETKSETKLVDASTQTFATGDLMCFYSIYNDESD